MKYKSLITTKAITTILSFLLLIVPMFVFAQIQNPLKGGTDVAGFVSILLGYVVKVGGVVATFAFIWAGFLYVEARGNPEKLENAKKVFINTCIGVAVLLGAQLIGTIISNTVNSLTTK